MKFIAQSLAIACVAAVKLGKEFQRPIDDVTL